MLSPKLSNAARLLSAYRRYRVSFCKNTYVSRRPQDKGKHHESISCSAEISRPTSRSVLSLVVDLQAKTTSSGCCCCCCSRSVVRMYILQIPNFTNTYKVDPLVAGELSSSLCFVNDRQPEPCTCEDAIELHARRITGRQSLAHMAGIAFLGGAAHACTL